MPFLQCLLDTDVVGLSDAGVFTLFATHFSALRQLEALYPSCKVCQLAVDTVDGRFDCTWQLKGGAVDVPHYGLLLAAKAGFPAEVRFCFTMHMTFCWIQYLLHSPSSPCSLGHNSARKGNSVKMLVHSE